MLDLTYITSIQFFENDLINSLILSLFIVIISIIFAKIILFITEKIIHRLTKRTKTKVDDLIIQGTKGPFYLLIIFFGLRLAVTPLNLSESINNHIVNIIYSFIILIIFVVITRVFNVVIDNWGATFAKKTKSTIDDSLISLFHKFINIFFIILGGIFILQQWGVQVGPFLASLGIAGIAIGFAVKDSLSNIFGGIQLIIDKAFTVGDTIVVGEDIFGKVEDIGIRSTRVKTFDNELLIVPNGHLANSIIKNYAQPELKTRVVVDFGVEYGANPKKVKKVIEEALIKMKGVLKDPEVSVVFVSMADFALLFKARFWVETYSERFDMKVAGTNLVYEILNKNKIGIPFPTQTIYTKKA